MIVRVRVAGLAPDPMPLAPPNPGPDPGALMNTHQTPCAAVYLSLTQLRLWPARTPAPTHTRRVRGPAALDRSCSVCVAYGVYSPRRSLFLTPPPRESGAAMFARVSRLVPVIAQHCAALRSIAQHCARPRTCQPLRHHCCVLTLPCLSPSGPVAILYALVRTGSRLVRGGPQRSAAVRAVPHMTATQCPVLTHAVPGLSLGVSAAVPMRTGVHTAS